MGVHDLVGGIFAINLSKVSVIDYIKYSGPVLSAASYVVLIGCEAAYVAITARTCADQPM